MAGLLDIMFGGGAEKEAADKDRAAAAQYQQNALGALGSGYNTGTGAINSAISGYTPLANLGQTYAGGANTLMDALGVNGAEGNARATAAFQQAPGYQYTLNQALDAVNRKQGAGGMGNSGNADLANITAASGLASQGYQSWLSNLMSTGQLGASTMGTAAAGTAGQYDSLANLAQTYANNQTGVYGNDLSTTVGANNLQAAGEAAGAKNLLGAGLSLASLGMGGIGGMGGLGSMLGGAGGMGSALGGLGITYGTPGMSGSNLYGPVAPR
jgi:hypothetical protein